ncbi:MAG TPA: FkbM family methyltransferase, partial [Pseudomonadales bacterium]
MLRTVARVFIEEGIGGIYVRLREKVAMKLRPSLVTSRYGVKLKGNWEDQTFLFYVQGAYGYYLSDLLHSAQDAFVFIDVGANQGLYSILASKNKMCERVHAFEPIHDTAAYLKENLKLNGCGNVSVWEVALTDKSGSFQMESNPAHTGIASLRDGAKQSDSASLKTIRGISRVELNDLEAPEGCRIFVKIDVEGFEETVLNELIACSFCSRIDDIFYEVDENWVDPHRLVALLRSRGFNEFVKVGGGAHYDVHARRGRETQPAR